jgi:uncharacterized protein
MDHVTMNAISDALFRCQIATFRFNFPFKERGLARPDSPSVATMTIARAIAAARGALPAVPLYAGGHSFGGRMTSHAVLAHALDDVRGLVFCAFPLHPAGKPGTDRAAHLAKVTQPMLFVSGTRDALATPALLSTVVDALTAPSTLVWLDTADHGYRVLKRQRTGKPDVFDEIGAAIADFMGVATA